MKLNLGCSDDIRAGWINVDRYPPADRIADLEGPWPWIDSSIDEILAQDVIEHLHDKIHTMNELWRVLKPGGRVTIGVPTTDGSGAWQDPTHVSFWNRRSFLYFEKGSSYRERFIKSYGVKAAFRVISESLVQTVADGPKLTIVLEAVK
jgi:SAM-dependent methyltransferase